MGSRRGIPNDKANSNSDFFHPRQKKSLGQDRALGHGTTLGFFLPQMKKILCFGDTSLYIALRDPIYTLHINRPCLLNPPPY